MNTQTTQIHHSGRAARPRRALAVTSVAAALALMGTACSPGSDDPEPTPDVVTVTATPTQSPEPSASPTEDADPTSDSTSTTDETGASTADPSASDDDDDQDDSTDPAPDGELAEVTPPAETDRPSPEGEFELGESITIDAGEQSTSMEGMVGLSVIGIEEGDADDLAQLDVPASEVAGSTPYYVTYHLTNLSGDVLDYFNPKAYLQLVFEDGGTEQVDSSLEDESFTPCPHGGSNDEFGAEGDTYQDCVIYLAPEGSDVEGVGYNEGYRFELGSGHLWSDD